MNEYFVVKLGLDKNDKILYLEDIFQTFSDSEAQIRCYDMNRWKDGYKYVVNELSQ
jgi:hypothetical protein